MGRGQGKNEMLSDVEGLGLASVLDVQSLFFLFLFYFLLLTRNLPFDSDVRQ